MRGLAIYTLVVMGFAIYGVLGEPSSNGVIGILMFLPIVVWAILVLVRGAKWGNKITITKED
jgi:hypothetical protein